MRKYLRYFPIKQNSPRDAHIVQRKVAIATAQWRTKWLKSLMSEKNWEPQRTCPLCSQKKVWILCRIDDIIYLYNWGKDNRDKNRLEQYKAGMKNRCCGKQNICDKM